MGKLNWVLGCKRGASNWTDQKRNTERSRLSGRKRNKGNSIQRVVTLTSCMAHTCTSGRVLSCPEIWPRVHRPALQDHTISLHVPCSGAGFLASYDDRVQEPKALWCKLKRYTLKMAHDRTMEGAYNETREPFTPFFVTLVTLDSKKSSPHMIILVNTTASCP